MTTDAPSTSYGFRRMRRAGRGVRAGAVAVAVLVAGLAAPLAASAASWGIVNTPTPAGAQSASYVSVTCLNGIDCWAVGSYATASAQHNLSEHFDGTGWTVVAIPDAPGSNGTQLMGVSCVASNDCWTVGQWSDIAGGHSLAEHWDGTAWTVVTSPVPPSSTGDGLNGVTCLTSINCWAIGNFVSTNSGQPTQTLTEQWNGSAWSIVGSADTSSTEANSLNAVTCVTATNCWAVGNYFPTSGTPFFATLVEHSTGSSWTIVSSPNPAGNGSSLNSVTCVTASNCWAVGSGQNPGNYNDTLIEQYNGASWAIVASPDTSTTQDNTLSGVTCLAATDCWAVGYKNIATAPDFLAQTLAVHFDGSNWSIVGTPNTATDQDNLLTGVTCVAGSACWAVGEGDSTSLVEKYLLPSSASLQDAPATHQYLLNGSDGTTWQAMDNALLADTFVPANSGTAVLSANADLWTFNAGFNQDIGICLVPGANAQATCPNGDLAAWKESGGFAGTFSPNAAYVQTTTPVVSGTTYTAFVVWKANKFMPTGDILAAGAGSDPNFSPSRLTVILPDSTFVASDASSTQQYFLNQSDGASWNYVDPSALKLTITPTGNVNTVLSANADLWTFNAGYNQDMGICVVAGTTLPVGTCPSIDVQVWKESGGFAGTLSPNAAFAQTMMPMTAQTYTAALVWKANKVMPSGNTITVGAGSTPTFSPTHLIAQQYSGTGAALASSTQQHILNGSDGSTWQVLDATNLTLAVPRAAGCQVTIGGNVDLWTFDAGYNQDIGIQVTPAGGTPSVLAWKESGGFAGTFSPNAAFVETALPISSATSYSVTLVWKTNKPMATGRHIAAAAGATGAFSPTTLVTTKHC
jgi:hypothetical protein